MTKEEAGALKWEPIRRPAPLFFQSIFAGAGLLFAWLFPELLLTAVISVPVSVTVSVLICYLMAAVLRRWSLLRWHAGAALFLIFFLYGLHTYYHVPEHHLRQVDLPLPRSVQLKLIPQEEPAWKPGAHGEQTGNAVCRVTAINPGDGWRPAAGKVWVRLKGDLKQVELGHSFYGYEATAGGYLEWPKPPAGPGQFDFASYLKSSGISHTFSVHLNDWESTEKFVGWRLLQWANHLRLYMIEVLQLGLDPESPWPSLMAGMLFGYRDGISAEMMNEFTVTGTLHLFAVSGQNVGMILWVCLIFLRSFGLIRWRWGWLVAPGLLMFCLSTGLESSASRALVMIVLVLAGWLVYRPITPLNLLGAAALILWAWDPWQLLDVGFQLSFLVLLVLLLATGFLARRLYLPLRPDVFIPRERLPRWRLRLDEFYAKGVLLLAASTVAWLASLPLIWFHFGLISPITVLSNCLVVPMAGAVVVLALFSVLASVVFTPLAIGFNLVNAKLLMLMIWIISTLANVPGGHFYVSRDSELDEDTFKLTLLDGVRHAPAILETRDRVVLFGAGTEREWKYLINPARQFLGHESFDTVVTLQANHRCLDGVPALLAAVRAREIYTAPFPSRSPAFRQWLKYSSEQADRLPQVKRATLGLRLWQESKVQADVCWPDSNASIIGSEDAGLAILLQLDGVKLLLAGNPSRDVERFMADDTRLASFDILIQGAHSRDPGLSPEWLQLLSPELLIRPPSGFYPEQDMDWEKRQLLQNLSTEWLPLDQTGPIQIRGRGGAFQVFQWNSHAKEFRKVPTAGP